MNQILSIKGERYKEVEERENPKKDGGNEETQAEELMGAVMASFQIAISLLLRLARPFQFCLSCPNSSRMSSRISSQTSSR